MITAVLFDLDDTLYPEMDFVKSGFRAAARHLSLRHTLDESAVFSRMMQILQSEGRGKVFDRLLEESGIFTEHRVSLLLSIYRSHKPDIHLYQDVIPAIERLKQISISTGIITDGMAPVQKNKVRALGLDKVFDLILYTDELAQRCSKPSTVPYEVALELLGVLPRQAAYVGDDPTKDFQGASALGMLTIQVTRPELNKPLSKSSEAQFAVKGLAEILPIIQEKHSER